MRRALLSVLLVLVSCGAGKPACPPAPVPLAGGPDLPPGFPTAPGVTYAAERQAGPSLVVEGIQEASLGDAFEDWRAAFTDAPGYDVIRDEIEAADAEVNFAGGGTTGQVRLVDRCAEHLQLSIVIRPEV